MNAVEQAHLVPVAANAENEYLRRRLRLDMTQTQIADEAGISRDTVHAVESGGGSMRSRRKITDALDRLEDEADLGPIAGEQPTPAPTPTLPIPGRDEKVVRFIVRNVYGAEALVVEVPPENMDELERAVDRIMRRLQARGPDSED